MEDGCRAQRFSAGLVHAASHLPLSPPVLLLIQAASQSHLALALCQHCTRFMGKHYSHLSLKDIFW